MPPMSSGTKPSPPANTPPASSPRLTLPNNLEGDACANVLLFNADRPIERLNIADTVKVQWNAYLGPGKLLLSDMGRVLMSILEDTSPNPRHLLRRIQRKAQRGKYGAGATYTPFPNARDRFTTALLKFGLSRKDIPPNLNFFKGIRIEPDGSLTFLSTNQPNHLTLRSKMNALIVIANTPHPLDPRPTYIATDLRLTAWKAPVTPPDDTIRTSTPETLRAFQNVDDYFLSLATNN